MVGIMSRRPSPLLFGLCGLLLVWAAPTAGAAEAVGWDRLAGFAYAAPAYEADQDEAAIIAEAESQIPAEIKALNDQELAVTGFMLPVRMDGGKVVEFLLVSDPMVCCYGAIPKLNEWVSVRLASGIEPLMDVPLTFAGSFKVGPVLDEGYLTSIYELDNAKLVR